MALVLVFAMNALFLKFIGFPLTRATIAWGALRIVPCFAYGCALYLVWRNGAVQSRMAAVLGASFFGAALILGAQVALPDPVLVAIGGGLILFLASLSSTGSKAFSNPVLVYLGEISYSIYMVHTLWDLIFVNGVSAALHIEGKQLPLGLWLILTLGVIPLASASYHLVERPARERLRTWRLPAQKRGLEITPV
jgi:peptidoglycan/LPS O-acetylase OafA/YrhL